MTRSYLVWSLVVAAILVGVTTVWWLTRPLPVLTATTWPGAYERAQAIAMFRPYGEDKRVDVRIAEYDGGLDHLRGELTSRNYDWDVIDFELSDANAACKAGLLEPLDAHGLVAGADGTPALQDFLPGALGPCWVGNVAFSQLIAFNASRFAAAPPRTLSDFFDLRRFPGPRALRRTPERNLEMALLADGVLPGSVYRVLSTSKGVARALRKLSTIRSSLIWWTRSGEAVAMLEDGRAAMAATLNGDVANAQMNGQGLGVIWDHQLYEFDVFAIPRGDPRKDRAFDFVRYATAAPPLAHMAEWVPFGPARRSSLPLIGRNPELGTRMLGFTPTTPARFSNAFAVDDAWWAAHGAAVAAQWRDWLDGRTRIDSIR